MRRLHDSDRDKAMAAQPLTAIIWDFDGTLVDTRRRNYSVVRRLMADVTGAPADRIPALQSLEHYDRVNRRYVNWRDLYRREFGFSEGETDRVGLLWSDYQLSDDTPAEPFDGILQVLGALGEIPHGIVSQNARGQIERALNQAAITQYFGFVIGYDGVPLDRQKPAPDGLLVCIEELTGMQQGRVLYIGDHETDVRCAHNAHRTLENHNVPIAVESVAASFVDPDEPLHWTAQPDHIARTPHDLIAIALTAGKGNDAG
jgi:HAD superfamily hydrolase (TIGR01549 family)